MTLRIALNCADARVLVIGDAPELKVALDALVREQARSIRLDAAMSEERYARRYLTPRPLLIVLGSSDAALVEHVTADALERGILLVDVLNSAPTMGCATLISSSSL